MGDLGTLAVAAVGVVGTLFSPVVTIRLSARLQRNQFDEQRRLALDERMHTERREAHAKERDCYVTLNAAARQYRVAQMNYLYALQEGRLTDEGKRELADARTDHGSAIAEAQMTATPKVLDEMEKIFSILSVSYHRIKRLEAGDPEPGGSFDEIRVDLLALWEQWKYLREAMRLDLGVE